MNRPRTVCIKKTEISRRTIFNIYDILEDPYEKRCFDVVVHDDNFNSVSAFGVTDGKQHSLSVDDTEAIIEKYGLKDIRESYTVRWWI